MRVDFGKASGWNMAYRYNKGYISSFLIFDGLHVVMLLNHILEHVGYACFLMRFAY